MSYKLYQSEVINHNPKEFIETCNAAYDHFTNLFKSKESTWNYKKYNFFSLSSTSILFYNFYKELNYIIRNYIGDDRPLWLECWINFHTEQETISNLKKHGHDFAYHGYISVDPKNTTTVFNNFEIKNKPGQIYLGPGGDDYEHYVRVDKSFVGKRITLGFDVDDVPNKKTGNVSFIPLL